jgi:tRNA A37 threonylcarbamoyltransferase TsaD
MQATSAQPMMVLGIETSCDETAAAIVACDEAGRGRILSNVVLSQIGEHRAFGGVVPEIAARAHVEALDGVIEAALDEAGIALADLDAVAATAGPGLIGGLVAGLMTAKALAAAASLPLMPVNQRSARPSTRPRSCSACPIRADPRWRPWRGAETPTASPSPAP